MKSGPTCLSLADAVHPEGSPGSCWGWTPASLLFNMLSIFVMAFLPRSKHLLISWLQSPSAVILEPKKIKSVTVSVVSPSICLEGMELACYSPRGCKESDTIEQLN